MSTDTRDIDTAAAQDAAELIDGDADAFPTGAADAIRALIETHEPATIEPRGELMDGDGNAVGDGTCSAAIREGRVLLRGDVSMLIAAHISAVGEPDHEPEDHIVMSARLTR